MVTVGVGAGALVAKAGCSVPAGTPGAPTAGGPAGGGGVAVTITTTTVTTWPGVPGGSTNGCGCPGIRS